MKYFGLIAFFIILMNLGLPSKVEKLKKQVDKLKSANKGGLTMSNMIKELIGKQCILSFEDEIQLDNYVCTILEADEDWVKYTYTDKKNNNITKIKRISSLYSIDLK